MTTTPFTWPPYGRASLPSPSYVFWNEDGYKVRVDVPGPISLLVPVPIHLDDLPHRLAYHLQALSLMELQPVPLDLGLTIPVITVYAPDGAFLMHMEGLYIVPKPRRTGKRKKGTP